MAVGQTLSLPGGSIAVIESAAQDGEHLRATARLLERPSGLLRDLGQVEPEGLPVRKDPHEEDTEAN
ncbi:MAG: hypothetical protein AAF851_06270 [Myxococcota bacterium]